MVLKNWKKIYPHIIFHLQFFEPFPISCYFFDKDLCKKRFNIGRSYSKEIRKSTMNIR